MKTVMVIEDDEDLREVIGYGLGGTVRLVEAEHGRAALDLIDEGGLPDLILLDMNMPIMNGWQFAAELRARGLRHVPIIVLTAAHDAARSAADIEAAGYLGKPFAMNALRAIIEKHLAEANASVRTQL